MQSSVLVIFAARLISARQIRYNTPNAVEMRNVKEDIGMVDKKSNAKVVSPHLFLHRKGGRVWRSYRRCGTEGSFNESLGLLS